MIKLRNLHLISSKNALAALPEGKLLVNTINAFSYNNARKDPLFAEALINGGALIPDGASIVYACKLLGMPDSPSERIAGWDLFQYEMERLNARGGKVMFLGSSEQVLLKIKCRALSDYPNIEVVTYSPPYKKEFSSEESNDMITAINECNPDLLWIGMTAPKQEKWIYAHWKDLDIHCHCGTIGAVFDFYAGTIQRAPLWYQTHGLEWLYRLCQEPKRMWKRYLLGNVEFLWYILMEYVQKTKEPLS